MRVLVSRPDKIGDVILALHGVKQLKRMLPDIEVFMHVSPYTRPLVEEVQFVDGCVPVGEDLEPYKFDAVVDLMAKNRTARWYFKPGIRLRIGNSARWFRFLYNRTRYIRRSYALMNEAEYNWELISLLDPRLKNTRLKDSLSLDDFTPFESRSDYAGANVIMPGVSVSAVGWDAKNWCELARIITRDPRERVLLLLGPAEEKVAATYHELTAGVPNISIALVSDFRSVIGILKEAKSFIGPSTGITHLASAIGVPGIALYPETRSMHPTRWMPFKSTLSVLFLSKKLSPAIVADTLTGKDPGKFSPTHGRGHISAFVICHNEERNIRRCLESIAWCDEIVVVDSGSKDRTVEICSQFTDRVFTRPWPGHSEQKQFALEQCRFDWVLNIDSDEEVSTELKSQIQRILSLPPSKRDSVKGYYLCRCVRFLHRWWDRGGWYPEYRMRLFQRSATRWGGVNPHEKAIVEGRTSKLRGHLFHYTYSGIPHQIDTLNRHSSNSAMYLYQSGKRSRLVNIMLNPAFRFFKFYVLKWGFLEGMAGFIVGCVEAGYTFLKYVKLWELEQSRSTAESSQDEILAKSVGKVIYLKNVAQRSDSSATGNAD